MSANVETIQRMVRRYLAQIADKLHVSRDSLLEMEDHLLSEIEDLMDSGKDVEEACGIVMARFGEGSLILAEFKKSNRGDVMRQLQNFLSHYFEPRAFTRLLLTGAVGFSLFYGLLYLSGTSVSLFVRATPLVFLLALTTVLTLTAVPVPIWKSRDFGEILHYIADSGGQNAILVGFWGFVAGCVMMLVVWQNPSEIGLNISFAIYCLMYGPLLRVFLLDPLKNLVKRKKSQASFIRNKAVLLDRPRFLAGVTLSLVVLVASLGILGNVAIFWDPISFLFVAGISLCPLLLKYGFQPNKALAAVSLKNDVLQSLPELFKSMSIAALCAGVVCTIVGIAIVLSNMSDPAKITPGLAVSILSLSYGFAGYYVWRSFERYSQFLIEMEDLSDPTPISSLAA